MWLLNAFSIQMLPECRGIVRFVPLTEDETRERLAGGFQSAIGHELTAALLSKRLGVDAPFRRVEVALRPADSAIVAQMRLPRGVEGVLPTEEELARTPVSYVLVDVLEA